MQAEIITIGDEILIGQIVDTNSAFISKVLNSIGVSVYQITSVQDHKQHILNALYEAQQRVDIVLITGGLGPTKDDITKHTLCEFFNDALVQNDAVLDNVEYLFKKYIQTPISEINRQQALVPKTATVLMNKFGTAPGMWFEKDNVVFVSMPGVPYEMKALMNSEVLPRIQKQFKLPYILHKTVLTYGMGESAIADKIEGWENNLPPHIKLAYLPNLGKVRLRLSAKGNNKQHLEEEVNNLIEQLQTLIGDIIYGLVNDHELEVLLGKLLTQKKLSLSVAESCTGGMVAEKITSVPGASAYFKGSVVTYATQTKVEVLGVDAKLIEDYSVVSAQVAEAMATQVKKLYKSDFAIATTGNAGPSKGDANAEVGTVFIAIATPIGVFSQKFNMGNHRIKVVNKAVNKAFEMLQKEILNF
jgi:nicotinamide-nucleotide amidase